MAANKTESGNKKKKAVYIILIILLSALVVFILVSLIHVLRIFNDPKSFFEIDTPDVMTDEVTNGPVEPIFPIPVISDTDESADTQPVEDEQVQKDETYNVLNIMLFGIDAFSDGSTSSGSEVHTDVSMVLTINFEKNTVDLVSLQRDTFTLAPGYRGFYKLNGVFNVGGGMDNKEGGFELVCRAAEVWLSGVKIPYYCGLDFEAVINLVDAIGGIDYDVDQPFTSHGGGKKYEKGMQHLDGKGVLGYLRIRKNADGLDKSRNTRQRKMLIAIFNKLKKEGKITQIPSILSAVSGGIYTNLSVSQMAALLNIANNAGVENINSRAVTGTIKMNYDWAFAFVDQQERVDLIKEVYGITANKVGYCTPEFEKWLHDTGFDVIKHIRQTESLLNYVKELKESGREFSEEEVNGYVDCYNAYANIYDAYEKAFSDLSEAFVSSEMTSSEKDALIKELASTFKELEKETEKSAEALAKAVGYKTKLSWTAETRWYEDPDINEIKVDFR